MAQHYNLVYPNERYIGDSLWQKTYATDSLPTRQIKKAGSKTQYYIEHTHTPIIDRDTYSAVQRLREKRKLDVKYNDDYQPKKNNVRKLQCPLSTKTAQRRNKVDV